MLDKAFYDQVEPLLVHGMGTEQVGPWLYHFIRMTRPRNVMEIGLGYTTPFILKALADNEAAFAQEREWVQSKYGNDDRRSVLLPAYFNNIYRGRLVAIDDYSQADTSAPRVLEAAEQLGIESHLHLIRADFRGASTQIPTDLLPFDFIWFDCGGAENTSAFFNEYWRYIEPEGGYLAMHYTYRWQIAERADTEQPETDLRMMPGDALQELRRQQAAFPGSFDMVTLLEPHKWHQGSLSLLRRNPASESRYQPEISPFGAALPGFSMPPVNAA